ncbi:unnamed protein product [Cochlearia groenlandica]
MGKTAKKSRKGKKAWRANISTEDIEDFFEKSTKDALSGGNLSAAPNDDLFRVDKSHDVPVKRKIEKHREKVLRCDSVLKKNPFVQTVSSSKKPKSKKVTKKPKVTESKTAKQAQKASDLIISKKTSVFPAVEVDPEGCSYNPTFESHEDMLAEAVAQEMQKVYKNELGPEPVPLTIEGDAINEDEKYFLEVDNVSEGEDDADDEIEVSEAGIKLPRTTKRVTRVVLNKRIRQKEVRKKLTKEKYKEKISTEIDSLPNILQEIAREDEDKQNKHLRRTIAKQEVLKIRPPRLGKHKYEAPPVQVLLTEEMNGSLRKLKACCTLARDRFKSLEKRGILVPTKNIRRLVFFTALAHNNIVQCKELRNFVSSSLLSLGLV